MRPLSFPVLLPVAGVSFHQDVLSGLTEGQELQVRHEPENPSDPNACLVLTGSGATIGYVPGALAPRLLSSAPSPYTAEVAELLGAPGRMGLRIRLVGSCGDAPAQAPQVSGSAESLSGRPLGVVVGSEDGMVLVRTSSGRTVSYPQDLVRVVLNPA